VAAPRTVWVRCLFWRCGHSAVIAESQYCCGFSGGLFLLGGLPGAALGFPTTATVLPGGMVGGDSQAERLRRAFLSVAVSRFVA